MVDDTANLKMFLYGLPNIKLSCICMNFIKIGRGHKIGLSLTRPLASVNVKVVISGKYKKPE